MRHILHIVSKDLRHAWPYGAAALAVLIVNTANFARVLASRGPTQDAALGVQVPLDWLLAITWALYYGVVLLGDAIPGTRQHWISRPLRWQSLLAAKLLLLPLFALPVAAAHLAQLSLRGFPLADHAAPVIANAFWLVFAGLLPVAALASLCRNLQQLALWILATAAAVLALQQWDAALPTDVQGVVDDVTIAAAVLGCAAILVWQYATRRTASARVATVALAIVLATLPHWPAALWRTLIHTTNNPVTLALSPPIVWSGRGLSVPLHAGNLSPQSVLKRNDWLVHISTRETATTEVSTSDSYEFGHAGELFLSTPSGFLTSHSAEPVNVDITGEFTVFSEPRHETIPAQGERLLPGIGHCRSWIDKLQIIECQSVLGAANRLEIVPVWAIGHAPNVKASALAASSEQAPLGLVPHLHPITLLSGDIFVNWSFKDAGIHLRTRTPIAHIQRSLQLRGIKLDDFSPQPKPQPPPQPRSREQSEPFRLGEILAPTPPKPTSPLIDVFAPHQPKYPVLDMPYEPLKAPK